MSRTASSSPIGGGGRSPAAEAPYGGASAPEVTLARGRHGRMTPWCRICAGGSPTTSRGRRFRATTCSWTRRGGVRSSASCSLRCGPSRGAMSRSVRRVRGNRRPPARRARRGERLCAHDSPLARRALPPRRGPRRDRASRTASETHVRPAGIGLKRRLLALEGADPVTAALASNARAELAALGPERHSEAPVSPRSPPCSTRRERSTCSAEGRSRSTSSLPESAVARRAYSVLKELRIVSEIRHTTAQRFDRAARSAAPLRRIRPRDRRPHAGGA